MCTQLINNKKILYHIKLNKRHFMKIKFWLYFYFQKLVYYTS